MAKLEVTFPSKRNPALYKFSDLECGEMFRIHLDNTCNCYIKVGRDSGNIAVNLADFTFLYPSEMEKKDLILVRQISRWSYEDQPEAERFMGVKE